MCECFCVKKSISQGKEQKIISIYLTIYLTLIYWDRIKGIMKIKTLQGQLDAMTAILKQLKSDKEQAAEQQSVLALKQLMNANIDKIKVGTNK